MLGPGKSQPELSFVGSRLGYILCVEEGQYQLFGGYQTSGDKLLSIYLEFWTLRTVHPSVHSFFSYLFIYLLYFLMTFPISLQHHIYLAGQCHMHHAVSSSNRPTQLSMQIPRRTACLSARQLVCLPRQQEHSS